MRARADEWYRLLLELAIDKAAQAGREAAPRAEVAAAPASAVTWRQRWERYVDVHRLTSAEQDSLAAELRQREPNIAVAFSTTVTSSPAQQEDPGANEHPGVEELAAHSDVEFPVRDWERFELTRFLGEGGMGRVYEAVDRKLQRKVAIKFLTRDDPGTAQRFMREAQAQARVEHDNVCQVYDVGEVDGHAYIAMQLVDGFSLKQAGDRLTDRQRVEIMAQVAEALHAAHRIGLIHRDIKPGNIMVEADASGQWRPFILDFGIAREVDRRDLTATGAVLGTPGFSAPEQVRGDNDALDCRTDVFGLGATLYWILAGRSAFEGKLEQILTGADTVEPNPLRTTRHDIARDVETIVLKCLHSDPEQRYTSALAVAQDLGRFLAGEPILARRAGPLQRVVKAVRRNPRISVIVTAALAVIVILSVVNGVSRVRARRQAVRAQRLVEQVKEVEGLLRVTSMMPLHDQTKEREQIRARLSAIGEEAKQLGSSGLGPGHYALGRGFLVLQEYDQSLRHLRQAWEQGYHAPEVAYALGLALGKQYEKQLLVAQLNSSEQLRSQRMVEIERELKLPALDYLRAGQSLPSATPAYHEAVIAFYEGEYELSLAKARQAFAEVAWLYEAKVLEAEAHQAMSTHMVLSGEYDTAVDHLEQAAQALAVASELARSDPQVRIAQCRCQTQLAEVLMRRGDTPEPAFANAERSCRQALVIDPELSAAHVTLATLFWRWADVLNDRGEEPEELLHKAIGAAERAIEIDDQGTQAYYTRGGALLVTGLHQMSHGADPRESFDLAIASFDKTIELAPRLVNAYDDRGYAFERRAQYELRHGIDPRPSVSKARASYREAIRLSPSYANAFNNMGIALWREGYFLLKQGEDADKLLQESIDSYHHAIELNPNYAYAFANLGIAYRTQALAELTAGRDPRQTLDAARAALHQALSLNPKIYWGYPELSAVAVLQARHALKRSRSPLPSLAQAASAIKEAITLNPRNSAALQTAAEIHRWRAHWYILQQRPPDEILAEISQGIAQARACLELNPSRASAMVEYAALLLLRAGQETDELAARTTEQAQRLLEEAVAANPFERWQVEQLTNTGGDPRP